MVAPIALNPFVRQVVLADGAAYRTGVWSPFEGIRWDHTIPINRDDPAARIAMEDPALADFLHWVRFPFFMVNRVADGRTTVEVADARYGDQYAGGWATRTVVIEPR